MGLNSLLNFFKLDGIDDEYEDYEYDEYDEEEVPSVKKTSVPRKTSAAREIPEDSVKSKNGFLNNSKPKVVSLNRSMMEVKIVQPTSFEDSQEICNTLLESKPVVVNLEGFDPDDAQRIMDFISGCIYAINGKYHQISKYIFIFTPENVDISGDSLSLGDGTATMPTISREF
ncbi:MAG: cell division protein SepF [Eubacterium sp.]|jgi:cell division inhibitor SepF|nr:cell division protein SepF [Eubacterium sp.]